MRARQYDKAWLIPAWQADATGARRDGLSLHTRREDPSGRLSWFSQRFPSDCYDFRHVLEFSSDAR